MSTFASLNAYQIMWLFTFFDLPVETKPQRHRATRFRKDLLSDGFTMMQFSVYVRHCASREWADVHIQRVRNWTPPEGQVSILMVTDRQYGQIVTLWGARQKPEPRRPQQLELF